VKLLYVPEMNSTTISIAPLFSAVCQIASSIPTSERNAFWFVVGLLGFWGWLIIIVAFIIWGAAELIFRFGSLANGCSREFNVAVGSLTFAVFQAIVYVFFDKLFGGWIYCTVWPNLSYVIVFPAVWLFLRGIGFWVY
jgi:hypothetical protein